MMEIERLPSPLRGWRIHTIEFPNRPSYVTLTDEEIGEIMQVVSGKKPDDSGREPDDLHLAYAEIAKLGGAK